MSESKESLKKIVLAGFGSGTETDGTRAQERQEEALLALLGQLPLKAMKEIRARLDRLIAEMEEAAPEEAVESIKEACLNPSPRSGS